MKVVAFNGSPKKNGNTYIALKKLAETLENEDIQVEIVHVGNQLIQGCLSCGGCSRNKNERCVVPNDSVNDWIQKMKEADGIILASPVHFSAVGGTMKSFLDRAFFVSSANGGLFRHKVGASVAVVRRSGGLPAFDQLNNFINYSEMLMPTSNYWNVIYGGGPGEAEQDIEGAQILRKLGANMAWLMKLVEYGKGKIEPPPAEKKQYMSFIR